MISINDKTMCPSCFTETAEAICPQCGHREWLASNSQLLPLGTILNGKYIVGKPLGVGGFGVTYLGYSVRDEKTIAIKEFFPQAFVHREYQSTEVVVTGEEQQNVLESGKEAFLKEAKTLARFNGHPNIVSVYEFFYENDTAYYVMEYLNGKTLKQYVTELGCNLTGVETVEMMRLMGEALMITHSAGVLHRDVSPANIFVCADGTYKLIDFGAARQYSGEQTKSMSVILNPGFAPIEQYQRNGNQGPWTDIYALGATAYWCLTGQLLDDPMTRLAGDSLVNAKSAEIEQGLFKIISKCVSIQAAGRYQDVPSLLRELEAVRSKIAVKQTPKPKVSSRTIGILAASAAAVVVVSGVATAAVLLPGMANNESIDTEGGRTPIVQNKDPEPAVNVEALFNTAMDFYNKEDYAKAFSYFSMAADYNHINSIYMLGECYMNGTGVVADAARAVGYYETAAAAGHSGAEYGLGEYEEASENWGRAYEWYLKASESHAGGMKKVGYYYEVGRIVEQDLAEALSWYDKAEKAGENMSEDVSRVTSMLFSTAQELYNNDVYEKAFKYFLIAAEHEDVSAMYYVGECYAYGNGTASDPVKALDFYEKAAEGEHSGATLAAARCYANAKGTVQNYDKALLYYLSAEALGERSASSAIADIYLNGRTGVYDYEKAYEYYKKAYDNGDTSAEQYINGAALARYAEFYYNGSVSANIAQNYDKALKFYSMAAEKGNGDAMNMLGCMYYNGLGVTKNDSYAFAWYKNAADAGVPEAMYSTAVLYHDGVGVARSYDSAYNYFVKAANNGYTAANKYISAAYLCEIAEYYYNGTGVTKSYATALTWYMRAGNAGSVAAMIQVGDMYYDGQGASKSYYNAMTWYKKAANAGNAEAAYYVGILYENGGYGVTASDSNAFTWCKKAAEKGHVNAMAEVAYMYDKGRGVTENQYSAFTWYKKAAEGGHVTAMNNLGYAYNHGEGVTKNLNEAIAWYSKAAENGNSTAMYNLGFVYEFEYKYYYLALSWYEKAKAAGNSSAYEAIARVKGKM